MSEKDPFLKAIKKELETWKGLGESELAVRGFADFVLTEYKKAKAERKQKLQQWWDRRPQTLWSLSDPSYLSTWLTEGEVLFEDLLKEVEAKP